MNPLLQYLLINKYSIKSSRKDYKQQKIKKITGYAAARNYRDILTVAKHETKNFFLILLGIISAGFGLKGFLLPNHFIDGGVTGISLLINNITGLSLSVLIFIINLPFIIIGYWQIGKEFTIKSVSAIIGLAICIAFVNYPVITSDKLLIAVFGGFFLGAGIGLTIRGGGVLDGTEILSLFISKKTGLSIGDIILIINIIIFSFAAWLLGIEVALYSVLIYMAASKTVDYLVEGIDEYIGVTIISNRTETMRLMIINKLKKGVTVYKGSKGYGKHGEVAHDRDIIYTVLTRLEVSRLNTEIERIDPDAFVVMNTIKDLKGGMVRRKIFKQ
jgi:uncharacterized membrane-anchored protein YitT (DUF2179 family)